MSPSKCIQPDVRNSARSLVQMIPAWYVPLPHPHYSRLYSCGEKGTAGNRLAFWNVFPKNNNRSKKERGDKDAVTGGPFSRGAFSHHSNRRRSCCKSCKYYSTSKRRVYIRGLMFAHSVCVSTAVLRASEGLAS